MDLHFDTSIVSYDLNPSERKSPPDYPYGHSTDPYGNCEFECRRLDNVPKQNLCNACVGVQNSINRAIHREWLPLKSHEYEFISDLDHIAGSDCTMCTFLRSCWGEDEIYNNLSLLAEPANQPFGCPGHFPMTTSFEVTCRVYREFMRVAPTFQILPASTGIGLSARQPCQNGIDTGRIKEWLSFCDANHQLCGTEDSTSINSMQVIDCSTMSIIPLASGMEYVTLSYVWGMSCVQTQDSDIQLHEQPKVIQDTIILVEELGFRYLWVGRYCIPQNDKEAKKNQIENMHRIYANSVLTIIAAAGTGPDRGLPGVGCTPRTQHYSIQVGHHHLVRIERPDVEIKRSHWNSRGWTYQEALLSKRRLVFTETQAYFQCQSMHCTDAVFVPFEELHDDKGNFHDKVSFGKTFSSKEDLFGHHRIDARISQFLARNLSFDGDVLKAMAGIFSAYDQMEDPVKFLCGLPLTSETGYGYLEGEPSTRLLTVALMWEKNGNFWRRPGFPSWSWAGWKRKPDISQKMTKTDTTRLIHRSYHETWCLSTIYPCMDIVFGYIGRAAMYWDKEHEGVLQLSKSDIHPISLTLATWTFRCRLQLGRLGYSIQQPRMPYTEGVYPLGFEAIAGSPANLDVLGLVLAYQEKGKLYVLLLNPTESGHTYEKIGSRWYSANDEDLVIVEQRKTARCGDVKLEWKEITIV